VQELLSDSGLGREMHVIVGQGQLDAVLHASPEDRRGFIEEAAGILKHRRRKEKTIRKLEAMQANLTRLSDLAGEIRRQLKPLGQQAEIAKEAASIAAIVRDARARLLADEVVELRAAITDFSRSESERKTERIVLQEQLDQNKLREGRLEQAQVGDAVDVARRVAFGLESAQERLRGLYTLANQRLALLGQQGDGPSIGTTISQAAVQEARDEADRLAAGVAEAEEALAPGALLDLLVEAGRASGVDLGLSCDAMDPLSFASCVARTRGGDLDASLGCLCGRLGLFVRSRLDGSGMIALDGDPCLFDRGVPDESLVDGLWSLADAAASAADAHAFGMVPNVMRREFANAL